MSIGTLGGRIIKARREGRLREKTSRQLATSVRSVYEHLIVNPIDKTYHVLMGRYYYPSYTLREHFGDRGYSYEASGRETLIVLKLLGNLRLLCRLSEQEKRERVFDR